MKTWLRKRGIAGLGAVVWLLSVLAWRVMTPFPALWGWLVFGATLPVGVFYLWQVRHQRAQASFWWVATWVYVTWWQLAIFVLDAVMWDAARATLARSGLAGLFVLGLLWLVYLLERGSEFYQRAAVHAAGSSVESESQFTTWNPLDLRAWYYGRQLGTRNRKLDQSLLGLLSYVAMFALALMVFGQLRGCREIYESPAGGGEQKTVAQVVRVQKVIRKKFVVNPYSAIVFEVPPIDEVKLQLNEITEHAYTKGYGEGAGAGFAGGSQRGKVRFIRLEYAGGDWEQDYGIGGDLNMLIQYGIRTQHRVAERTESRRIAQLANFPLGKSPPLVYMTGQRNISLSTNEVKILREFVTDKHGMIFCDNGGSRHFHNQFLAAMNRVLPDVRPVAIPLDDVIHRVPFQIPFLPYVAPHGGKEALGWYQDGRWLAYYHPGDIGDAWSDGHAGVDPEVWEACYQLGTNVIFYAHVEYAKWLEAQKQGK